MRVWTSKDLLLFCLLLSVISTSGCSWQVSLKPSFVIIAVEGLNSERLDCSNATDENESALSLLCRDSVRYTHAYTPSTMSQPAIASILTGLYPHDHGVWHNGPHFLSEEFETIGEAALRKGYRTAFFSGGAPIWRKSGFDQGFELFEDNVDVNFSQPYRPLHKTVDLIRRWLNVEVAGDPFLIFSYASDLQFPHDSTTTNSGLQRGRGEEGQLQELDESIASLITELRKMQRWDNTHVLLVGLNGKTERFREQELPATNLQSENTQVTFFWKPARKIRDAGIQWTVDPNVSLVDIGTTLFQMLGVNVEAKNVVPELRGFSLASSLERPNINWDKDRFILTESAWASWREAGNTRFALRRGYNLYVHDNFPKVYNTLNDRLEQHPISVREPTVKTFIESAKNVLTELKAEPWEPLQPTLFEKLRLAQDFSNDKRPENWDARLAILYEKRPWDDQIARWVAQDAIQKSNWKLLKEIAVQEREFMWLELANKQLSLKSQAGADACRRLLNKNSKLNPAQCDDEEWLLLVEFINSKENDARNAEEKFLSRYIREDFEEFLAKENFRLGLIWDTNIELPLAPRRSQIFLSFPENDRLKVLVNRRVTKAKSAPDIKIQ